MNILPHYYVILFPVEVHLLKGRCWRYFNLTWQKSEHFSEIEKYPFSLEQRNSRTYLMYSADWREWKELVQCKFTKFLPIYQMRRLFTSFIAYTVAVLWRRSSILKISRIKSTNRVHGWQGLSFLPRCSRATPLVFTWLLLHVGESGFRENFTCKIWNHRLWNPEYSSRNSESH